VEETTVVRRKVSRGQGAEPAEPAETPSTTTETPPDEAPGAPSADAPAHAPSATSPEPVAADADQFDALGTEIAAVLRQAQETSERVRTEAAEHALSTTTQAEAEARRIVEKAEAEARQKLAQAEAQIEQQWTAAAQQLEEATQALEVAREQDRALRQDAAEHLSAALAARDAGFEVLQGATRQIERAEAAARDLEAHAEEARQEAAQIAVDLHELAEHFGEGSGVIDLRAAAVDPEELAAIAEAAEGDASEDRPAPPTESTDAT